MTKVSSLCVYCGSRIPPNGLHKLAAERLGTELAENGIRLIYGGGHVGLMGVIADATLAAGGEVIGIIPGHLAAVEVGHDNLTELHIVDNMHRRKERMFEMADAFVSLPGGLGTLDETFEIITWRQLKLHDKPIVIVNDEGYWHPLLHLIDHVIDHGFADPSIRELYTIVDEIHTLVPTLLEAPAPKFESRLRRI